MPRSLECRWVVSARRPRSPERRSSSPARPPATSPDTRCRSTAATWLVEGTTMLQVRVHGPGDARVDEVDPPEAGARDAIIRIAACGICGSDLSYIRLGSVGGPRRRPLCL